MIRFTTKIVSVGWGRGSEFREILETKFTQKGLSTDLGAQGLQGLRWEKRTDLDPKHSSATPMICNLQLITLLNF